MAKMPEEIVQDKVYRVDAVKIPYLVSVLLIREDDGWALVDTGRSSQRVQEALDALGARPHELKRIYLTHHHPEHVGGLPNILWLAPDDVELWTSEHEAEILSGERDPDPSLDPLVGFIGGRGLPRVPMDRYRVHLVSEGDPFGRTGFRVIDTPGHTLGHTSLLRDENEEEDGLLFAADAFGNVPEIRVGVNNAICTDPVEAKRSAEKLLKEEFKFTTVIFSHGKPLRENAKRRLCGVVERYRYA